MPEDVSQSPLVVGRLKWFDPIKGYGFIVPEDGGGDILLHMSALKASGFGAVVEGSRLVCETMRGARGLQVTLVRSIDEETCAAAAADSPSPEPGGPLTPARVKWFDRTRGFGFVNLVGDPEDIFLHMEVLRRYGMPHLEAGEAVIVRVEQGPRGRMAVEIRPWEFSYGE